MPFWQTTIVQNLRKFSENNSWGIDVVLQKFSKIFYILLKKNTFLCSLKPKEVLMQTRKMWLFSDFREVNW